MSTAKTVSSIAAETFGSIGIVLAIALAGVLLLALAIIGGALIGEGSTTEEWRSREDADEAYLRKFANRSTGFNAARPVNEEEQRRKAEEYLNPGSLDSSYLGQRLKLRPQGHTRYELEGWVRNRLAEVDCLRFAWLEMMWLLSPPCGPVPQAGWANPPFRLSTPGRYTVYVVEIDAYMSDGSIRSVFKAGLTGQAKVIGSGGRFSEASKVRRVVTKKGGLTARQAWRVEQKMLTLMPNPDWVPTFEEEVARRTGVGEGREVVEPKLGKADRNRLGPSEWREWYWGDEELKATLRRVVDLTPAITEDGRDAEDDIEGAVGLPVESCADQAC